MKFQDAVEQGLERGLKICRGDLSPIIAVSPTGLVIYDIVLAVPCMFHLEDLQAEDWEIVVPKLHPLTLDGSQ